MSVYITIPERKHNTGTHQRILRNLCSRSSECIWNCLWVGIHELKYNGKSTHLQHASYGEYLRSLYCPSFSVRQELFRLWCANHQISIRLETSAREIDGNARKSWAIDRPSREGEKCIESLGKCESGKAIERERQLLLSYSLQLAMAQLMEDRNRETPTRMAIMKAIKVNAQTPHLVSEKECYWEEWNISDWTARSTHCCRPFIRTTISLITDKLLEHATAMDNFPREIIQKIGAIRTTFSQWGLFRLSMCAKDNPSMNGPTWNSFGKTQFIFGDVSLFFPFDCYRQALFALLPVDISLWKISLSVGR